MGSAEPVLNDHLQDQVAHESEIDEYYYGYRTIIENDENGDCQFKYRPLTFDDLLEPEEGDVYMEGSLHDEDIYRLKSIFRYHLRNRDDLTIYSDLKIIWGIDDLKNPAPDISVLKDVKDPKKPRGEFHVQEEETRPFFILEVVSPRYRKADVDKKPEIYRRAGVKEYVIVDPGLKNNEISYKVSGYRLIGSRYIKIPQDEQGRIRIMTLNVFIGPVQSGADLVVYDAGTGEEILPLEERAEQANQRAEQASLRAEHERKRADAFEQELIRLKEKMRNLESASD